MNCAIIQHVLFEDLGTFKRILEERGWTLSFCQAGAEPLPPARFLDSELSVVLGGPIGVNDGDDYPFIKTELELIKKRIDSGRPILGICLGAQFIAKAMGARVYPNAQKEICWSGLDLSGAGRGSPLGKLEGAAVLHWHGDTFDIPEGAELLASTPVTRNQAFRAGGNILALQFHPEADSDRLEQWLIGHTCELGASKISPEELREGGRKHGKTLKDKGAAFFQEWLDGLRI